MQTHHIYQVHTNKYISYLSIHIISIKCLALSGLSTTHHTHTYIQIKHRQPRQPLDQQHGRLQWDGRDWSRQLSQQCKLSQHGRQQSGGEPDWFDGARRRGTVAGRRILSLYVCVCECTSLKHDVLLKL